MAQPGHTRQHRGQLPARVWACALLLVDTGGTRPGSNPAPPHGILGSPPLVPIILGRVMVGGSLEGGLCGPTADAHTLTWGCQGGRRCGRALLAPCKPTFLLVTLLTVSCSGTILEASGMWLTWGWGRSWRRVEILATQVCGFPGVVLTKCHPMGLKTNYSHSPGDRKSRIKVSAGVVPSGGRILSRPLPASGGWSSAWGFVTPSLPLSSCGLSSLSLLFL